MGIWGYVLEESKPNKPIVVGVWEGLDTSLPGIVIDLKVMKLDVKTYL